MKHLLKKDLLFFLLFLFAGAIVMVGCKKKDEGPNYDQTKLNVISVTTAPTVDGDASDAAWADAVALTIPLGETANPPNDPSKVNNCAGCHAFSSSISVTVKAVHTADQIFILTEWPDPTASFTRGNSWVFTGGAWDRSTDHPDQSEDRIAYFFPIGSITGDPYSTGGCMTKCHMYYPTDNDPHVSTHGIVDDAWLSSGTADMWHSKAARSGAIRGASASGITVDNATHEVTGGTITLDGYMDDKWVGVWKDDTQNGEDGGRYGDAGTSTYSHNRISDKSRPKYMEKNPTDYADAMFLLQSEIDGGECVGDATNGVSDSDAATYWPAYEALNAVVPERILRNPAGSRGDILFSATWTGGKWTTELSRKLNTGNTDDVQFTDLAKEYLFNVAEFDNSRHGYEHRVSASYYMKFY